MTLFRSTEAWTEQPARLTPQPRVRTSGQAAAPPKDVAWRGALRSWWRAGRAAASLRERGFLHHPTPMSCPEPVRCMNPPGAEITGRGRAELAQQQRRSPGAPRVHRRAGLYPGPGTWLPSCRARASRPPSSWEGPHRGRQRAARGAGLLPGLPVSRVQFGDAQAERAWAGWPPGRAGRAGTQEGVAMGARPRVGPQWRCPPGSAPGSPARPRSAGQLLAPAQEQWALTSRNLLAEAAAEPSRTRRRARPPACCRDDLAPKHDCTVCFSPGAPCGAGTTSCEARARNPSSWPQPHVRPLPWPPAFMLIFLIF